MNSSFLGLRTSRDMKASVTRLPSCVRFPIRVTCSPTLYCCLLGVMIRVGDVAFDVGACV